jgi:hypothetical protein
MQLEMKLCATFVLQFQLKVYTSKPEKSIRRADCPFSRHHPHHHAGHHRVDGECGHPHLLPGRVPWLGAQPEHHPRRLHALLSTTRNNEKSLQSANLELDAALFVLVLFIILIKLFCMFRRAVKTASFPHSQLWHFVVAVSSNSSLSCLLGGLRI